MKHPEASTGQFQELIAQGAAGQASAYDQLLKQASDRLLRLTRKMFHAYPRLQRWEQTDDIFQTAAMRLLRSLAEVKPPTVAAFWGLAATQIRRTLIDLCGIISVRKVQRPTIFQIVETIPFLKGQLSMLAALVSTEARCPSKTGLNFMKPSIASHRMRVTCSAWRGMPNCLKRTSQSH